MPDQHEDGSILGQLLVEQGKMAKDVMTMRIDVAVIKEQLKDVPNLESRIRALEVAKAKIIGGASAAGILSGAVATLIYWALSHH